MTRSETPDASEPTEAEQPTSADSGAEVPTDEVTAVAEPARSRWLKVSADFKNPFSWGFVATIGGLLALDLGGALA